jgi:transcriptional regulator with XRE-family HTH domain
MHPIAEYRVAKGLTQGQLAVLVGVSITSEQTWERGAIPRPRYVPRLAEALGVDALQLLREIKLWQAARINARAAGATGE